MDQSAGPRKVQMCLEKELAMASIVREGDKARAEMGDMEMNNILEELGPLVSSKIDLEAHLAKDVETFVVETMKKPKYKSFSPAIKELVKEKLLNSQERYVISSDIVASKALLHHIIY